MVAAWKTAGLSFNRYLAIAARVLRKSLKEQPRLAAERRGDMELKMAKWTNGKQGEIRSLNKIISEHNSSPS